MRQVKRRKRIRTKGFVMQCRNLMNQGVRNGIQNRRTRPNERETIRVFTGNVVKDRFKVLRTGNHEDIGEIRTASGVSRGQNRLVSLLAPILSERGRNPFGFGELLRIIMLKRINELVRKVFRCTI